MQMHHDVTLLVHCLLCLLLPSENVNLSVIFTSSQKDLPVQITVGPSHMFALRMHCCITHHSQQLVSLAYHCQAFKTVKPEKIFICRNPLFTTTTISF